MREMIPTTDSLPICSTPKNDLQPLGLRSSIQSHPSDTNHYTNSLEQPIGFIGNNENTLSRTSEHPKDHRNTKQSLYISGNLPVV